MLGTGSRRVPLGAVPPRRWPSTARGGRRLWGGAAGPNAGGDEAMLAAAEDAGASAGGSSGGRRGPAGANHAARQAVANVPGLVLGVRAKGDDTWKKE